MPQIPKFYYAKELLSFWISEERLYSAAMTINHALWEEWIVEQNELFENYRMAGKQSMERHLNKHPVYAALTSLTFQDACFIVTLGESLSSIANEPSAPEMLARLRDFDNANPAIFELVTASSLSALWFAIEGIQVSNPKGNPVEIVASRNGEQVWIECKSTKRQRKIDGYGDKLLQSIQRKYEEYKNKWFDRGWMAFLIEIEGEIQNNTDFRLVRGKITEMFEIMYLKVPKEKFPTGVCSVSQSPVPWKLVWFLLTDMNYTEILKLMKKKAVIFAGYSYSKKSTSHWNLPDPEEMRENKKLMSNMIWIGFPYEKAENWYNKKSFDKQLKDKISQQKSLLDGGHNVILVFDEEAICDVPTAIEVAKKYAKYPKLTVLSAKKEAVPIFHYMFTHLLMAENHKEIFSP